MILRSFGCSFIYGTDLSSPSNTWPALIASNLNMGHECHARGGSGNLKILESISKFCDHDSVAIINWTWIDRFDFVDPKTEWWESLRPSLDHEHATYYFRNLHSQYRDVLTNLIYIKTALDFLLYHDVKFVMTFMDDLLFEPIKETWHDPTMVAYLQKSIRPYMHDFEGKNFLDWSRANRFAVSDSFHPLDDAHAAAADYMMPFIESILHKA